MNGTINAVLFVSQHNNPLWKGTMPPVFWMSTFAPSQDEIPSFILQAELYHGHWQAVQRSGVDFLFFPSFSLL
jgi:hypothetical protein